MVSRNAVWTLSRQTLADTGARRRAKAIAGAVPPLNLPLHCKPPKASSAASTQLETLADIFDAGDAATAVDPSTLTDTAADPRLYSGGLGHPPAMGEATCTSARMARTSSPLTRSPDTALCQESRFLAGHGSQP